MRTVKKLGWIFTLIFCLSKVASAQTKTVAIEDIDSLLLIQKKPILILLSTEWCKYCEIQKKQLEKNKDFLKQGNNFYYVLFDAERKDSILFNKQIFQYKAAGLSSGIHELATALNGSENITFPTWVVLDYNYQVLFKHQGVLLTKQLNEVLNAVIKLK